MIQSRSCLSDVDVKLSQVHMLLSEINQTMSISPVPFVQSRKLLPRYNFILSEIKWFVALSQNCCEGDADDDETESLWWDNNNNYHLYYNFSFVDADEIIDDDY